MALQPLGWTLGENVTRKQNVNKRRRIPVTH